MRRTLLTLAATAGLTLALTLPALAQGSKPVEIEEQTMAKTWRKLTPESASVMSQGAIDALRGIAAARRDIKAGKNDAARRKLETVLSTLLGVRAQEPITVAAERLRVLGTKDDVTIVEAYRQDHVPIMQVVADHEKITDMGTATKGLNAAQQAAVGGGAVALRGEVLKVRNTLIEAEADLPVARTYVNVAAAADALLAKKPAVADKLLVEALGNIEINVVKEKSKSYVFVPKAT